MKPMYQTKGAARKGLALAFVAGLLLVSQMVGAAGLKLTQYPNVERFTDTGRKDSRGDAIVRWEQGTLYVKEGFIPIASAEYSASQFKLDAATLAAIDGKSVGTLSLWVQFQNTPGGGLDLSAFQRSSETYSINSVPYILISVRGSGGTSPGKPSVSVSAVQPNAGEAGPVNGRFLIALDAARGQDVKVAFALAGKAKNGKDYVRIAKSVLIPAGNVSAFVEIVPIDDGQPENTETVRLTLQKKPGYKLSGSKSADVAITDND